MDANEFFDKLKEKSHKRVTSICQNPAMKIKGMVKAIALNPKRPRNRSASKPKRVLTKPSSIKGTNLYRPWNNSYSVKLNDSNPHPLKKPMSGFSPLTHSLSNQFITTFSLSAKELSKSPEKPLMISSIPKDQKSLSSEAKSKWFFTDGSFEWRVCKVLSYDAQHERYSIEWPNGKRKEVSKINILFSKEEKPIIEERICQTKKLRKRIFKELKHKQLIRKMNTPVPFFPLPMFDKILYFIRGNKQKLKAKTPSGDIPEPFYFQTKATVKLWKKETTHMISYSEICAKLKVSTVEEVNQLFFRNMKAVKFRHNGKKFTVNLGKVLELYHEISQEFFFAVHEFEFNKEHATDNSRKGQYESAKIKRPSTVSFKTFDSSKRVMVQNFIISEEIEESFACDSENAKDKCKNPTTLGVSDYEFIKNLNKINRELLHARPKFLQVMQNLNKRMLKIEKLRLVCSEYAFSTQLQYFELLNKMQTDTVFQEIEYAIIDTQYEIQEIMNAADQERQQRNEEKNKAKIFTNQAIDLEDTLNPKLIAKFAALVNVCNKMIEKSIGKIYKKSVNLLIKQIRTAQFQHNEFVARKFPSNSPGLKVDLECSEAKFKIDRGLDEVLKVIETIFDYSKTKIESIISIGFHEFHTSGHKFVFIDFDPSRYSLLKQEISQVWEPVDLFLKKLEKFEHVINLDTEKLLAKHTRYFDGDKILRLIQKYSLVKTKLEKVFLNRNELNKGFFIVRIEKVSKMLYNKCEIVLSIARESMSQALTRQIASILQQKEEILDTIQKDPKNLEDLSSIEAFMNNRLENRRQTISNDLLQMSQILDYIEQSNLGFEITKLSSAWELYQIPNEITAISETVSGTLEEKEKQFTSALDQSRIKLFQEISELEKSIEQLKCATDMSEHVDMIEFCSKLKYRVECALEDSRLINTREAILNLKITDFKVVEDYKKDVFAFHRLWTYIGDFLTHKPHWMKQLLFCELDKDEIVEKIEQCGKDLPKMINSTFANYKYAVELVKAFKQKVDKFSLHLPIIQLLKNNALKKRHWEKIRAVTGIPRLSDKIAMKLKDIINEGVYKFMDKLEEISERASKELQLEKQKVKMEEDWQRTEFTLAQFKSTEYIVIIEPELILELIDDHLGKTNSMCNSPYVTFFKKDMSKWRKTLQRYQDTIEEWLTVQKHWQYLYPLFQNKDIKKQLPEADAKFFSVHSFLESLMKRLQLSPVVAEVINSTPKMLEILKSSLQDLEQIMKSLNEYLNTKRKFFPRFYFLSNDELLGILSNSRDIELIPSFIGKCFEGVDTLGIEEMAITSMQSPEGEIVELKSPSSLVEDEELKFVEIWMNGFEESMKSSLRSLLLDAFADFPTKSILDWMKGWPSQLVLTVLMLSWTRKSESAILESTESLQALQSLLAKQNSFVSDLAEAVSQVSEDLIRRTVSSSIVIEVHNRDTIEALLEKQVNSTNDFDWLAQLRYYFNSGTVTVKIIDTATSYAYEYIGVQSRLVMTPLTDRCYRTLMSAFRLHLGGAPEGPAGTGKTETVKDLSKALAIKCIVFNCSDQLDHLSMARLFTGLVSSGSWSCFDEFNRIETEVLSVIAAQILSIQNALRKETSPFLFENELVPLVPTCAIFITMNPDYSGRSQLPDNLKSLFRSVAMMAPDFSMIAEIYLFSFGFKYARTLSRKIITLLKISSQQLSSRDHYDYGLRTLISIINTAGIYKREDPGQEQEESQYLLRALYDSNLPKFLPADAQLFKDISTDLFPSTVLKSRDTRQAEEVAEKAMIEMGLSFSSGIVERVIQLLDMLKIRNGIMLIGEAFSGKSSTIQILARVLESLGGGYPKFVWIYPKAITLDQLYGDIDSNSHDWIDGILSLHLRSYCKEATRTLKWVVCDGPVDPIWIETMNTVLDDNKKLCLTSGEIIKLTPQITMLFEVDHLKAASPATVSRCGMIYSSGDQVLKPGFLLESWLKELPLGYHFPKIHEFIRFLFYKIAEPCIQYASSSNIWWGTINFLRVYECSLLRISRTKEKHNEMYEMHLEKYMKALNDAKHAEKKQNTLKKEKSIGNITKSKDEEFFKQFCPEESKVSDQYLAEMCSLFMFSIVWSLGASLAENERPKFDTYIRDIYFNIVADSKTPYHIVIKSAYHTENCYLMNFNLESHDWEPWKLPTISFNQSDLTNFYVPTLDTEGYQNMMRSTIKRGVSLMVLGSTGTGKSVLAKKIMNVVKDEKLNIYFDSLNPRTSAENLQDSIFGRLSKRKKNTFGPDVGKQMVLVIDDMHMPLPEPITDAQPPIEILRQLVDRGEWFRSNEVNKLVDICIFGIASNKNEISRRFLKNLCLVLFVPFSRESLVSIFTHFLSTGYQNHASLVTQNIPLLVEMTIKLFTKTLKSLPPTPTKSHYQFNLRDISNVFKGMISVPHLKLTEEAMLFRLWTHECLRVFADRLVEQADSQIFSTSLSEILAEKSSESIENYDDILFCNFFEEKNYQECVSIDKARDQLEMTLADYNGIKSNKNMDLELFDAAIKHVSRICRVLSLPMGNGLLIGMGGSGRLSLSKLSAFAIGHLIIEISPTKSYTILDWNEDIKNVLFQAGAECNAVALILKESDLKDEAFFENVHNLLNNGEIPNLHSKEDKETIASALKNNKTKVKETEEIFEEFLVNVKTNLHILMCFSPIGDSLRKLMRLFPSLVNCCTINWFSEWPQEALISLANKYIKESEIGDTPEIQEYIKNACLLFYTSTKDLSKTYYNEKRRVNYVTPSKYLYLLNKLKDFYNNKKNSIGNVKNKFQRGVSLLNKSKEDIKAMTEEILNLKPVLEDKTQKTEELIKQIEEKKKEEDITQQIVTKEQKVCAVQAGKAEEIQKECERIFAATIPVLKSAKKALTKLDKKDLVLVKSMQNPPEPVRLVIESIVVINKLPPIKVQNPKDHTKFVYDYWQAGKKLMQRLDFQKSLLNFDETSITQTIIDRLRPYFDHPQFNPDIVKYSSTAAEGLCKWVIAMRDYYNISEDIKPKEKALELASNKLKHEIEALHDKEVQLKAIEDHLDTLKQEYEGKNQSKIKLENEINHIADKLKRAQKLIKKLGGEQSRWEENIAKIELDTETLLGDSILSAGFSSYLGNFLGTYRERILEEKWLPFIKSSPIRCTENYSLREAFGQTVEIQRWIHNGLPNDSVSIENAIIMASSDNWPLMIDPQGQAGKWLKRTSKMEKTNFKVSQSNAGDLSKDLENAMAIGAAVLIENIGEVLDITLDPLLTKAFYHDGGSLCIKIGDTLKPYDKSFKLYMTTSLPSPVFSPEVMSQTTILDFTITHHTLAEQLLSLVCMKELPEETEEKNRLASLSAEYIKELQECQDKIFELVQSAGDNILDNKELVMTLTKSKKTAEDVERKLAIVKENEIRISQFQEAYSPISSISSVLYFCTADMVNINPIYVFSMDSFLNIFNSTLEEIPETENQEERIQHMIHKFRMNLYNNTVMSLFERDKLIFSFLMSIRLLQHTQGIDPQEWKFLLTGYLGSAEEEKSEVSVDSKIWKNICEISELASMKDLKAHFKHNYQLWTDLIQRPDETYSLIQFDSFTKHLPAPYNDPAAFSSIQRLCLLRAIKPEGMMQAIKSFVYTMLGEAYLKSPQIHLQDVLKLSTPTTPLIYILTPGSDPQGKLSNFAEQCHKELTTLSLGKGQEEVVTKRLINAMIKPHWVLLQNCHLATKWLNRLYNILENPEQVNRDFRIWLTTMSHPEFPVSLLYSGLIIIDEPPQGLKSSLRNIYSDFKEDKDFFYQSKCPARWHRLLYALSFFHCSVLERRKFGALGWNIQYAFNDFDLSISAKQLKLQLEENEEVPFKALNYLVSECNYGGKITDDRDRRTIQVILQDFYNENVLSESYSLSNLDTYKFPPFFSTLQEYIEFIETLPYEETPEVFGLHANASITSTRKDVNDFFQRILDLQPSDQNTAGAHELYISSLSEELIKNLPSNFVVSDRDDSVIRQEITKFNKLLDVVKDSLKDLLRAVSGAQLMNSELEKIQESILINKVPELWTDVSYASCKPLSSWVSDLSKRIEFFKHWHEKGRPDVVWISAFFFPQSFLTSILQSEARSNPSKPEIDSLSLDFEVKTATEVDENWNLSSEQKPQNGCLITGLFLEGATWLNGKLDEPAPRELFCPMPPIHVIPVTGNAKRENTYSCPVYKTTQRSGVFLSSGFLPSYILTAYLPTDKPENHWVKRGTALISQLDD